MHRNGHNKSSQLEITALQPAPLAATHPGWESREAAQRLLCRLVLAHPSHKQVGLFWEGGAGVGVGIQAPNVCARLAWPMHSL